MDIQAFFSAIITETLIKQLLTLLGLILLQVILAVALAIKNKEFVWSDIGNFYLTKIVPYVIGWLTFVIVTQLITVEMLGEEYVILVGDKTIWASWLVVVVSLGARIVTTAKELYGDLSPLKDGEEKTS